MAKLKSNKNYAIIRWDIPKEREVYNMTKKSNYKVDESRKEVSYTIGSLTDKQKTEVSEYKEMGYNIIVKQKERKSGLTYAKMREQAKGKSYAQELEAKIEAKENYMLVRKWFLEQASKK